MVSHSSCAERYGNIYAHSHTDGPPRAGPGVHTLKCSFDYPEHKLSTAVVNFNRYNLECIAPSGICKLNQTAFHGRPFVHVPSNVGSCPERCGVMTSDTRIRTQIKRQYNISTNIYPRIEAQCNALETRLGTFAASSAPFRALTLG